jgi:2-iminobutanoate/2-iminopropanoate deaminase
MFVSGQIALDANGSVSGGIREQTRRVLDNIAAILAARGCGLERIVKTTVYLKDLAHLGEMNEEYAAHFTAEPKPARETVQVAKLPKDALVEISCIAYLGD